MFFSILIFVISRRNSELPRLMFEQKEGRELTNTCVYTS
jgi:hypothetical protein